MVERSGIGMTTSGSKSMFLAVCVEMCLGSGDCGLRALGHEKSRKLTESSHAQ